MIRTGMLWYLKEEIWHENSNNYLNSHEEICKMLELFQDSVNIHNHPEGTVLKFEKRITDTIIEDTEKFLQALHLHKESIKKRTKLSKIRIAHPPVLCLSYSQCPEVISNEIMSYLSPITRLENLRTKYTDDFLIQGLSKKTIPQLIFIWKNFYRTIYIFELACKKSPDMRGEICRTIEDLQLWQGCAWNVRSKKKCKVLYILGLFHVAESQIYDHIIKRSVYDDLCNRVISILHILVSVINNPKRKIYNTQNNAP
jgi:hypothetical protein